MVPPTSRPTLRLRLPALACLLLVTVGAASARAADPVGDVRVKGLHKYPRRALDLVDVHAWSSVAGLYVKASTAGSFEVIAGRDPLRNVAAALVTKRGTDALVTVTQGPSRRPRNLAVEVSPTGASAPFPGAVVRDGRKLVYFLPGVDVPTGTQVVLRTFLQMRGRAAGFTAAALIGRSADDAVGTVPDTGDVCATLRTQIHELSGEIVALSRKAAAGKPTRGAAGLTAGRAAAVKSQADLCNPISGNPKQAPVTIGPDLNLAPDTKRHTRQDTIDTPLTGRPGALSAYTFPVAGNVRQFSIRGWGEGGGAGISFIIVHPQPDGKYLVKQYAGNFLLPGQDGIYTYRTAYGVPVQPGDTFGVYNNGGVDWHIFNANPSFGTFEHEELTLDEGEQYDPDLVSGVQTLITATEDPY